MERKQQYMHTFADGFNYVTEEKTIWIEMLRILKMQHGKLLFTTKL